MPRYIVEANTLDDLNDGNFTVEKQIIECQDCIHWIETDVVDEITGEPEQTCNRMYFEWGDEHGYCSQPVKREDLDD